MLKYQNISLWKKEITSWTCLKISFIEAFYVALKFYMVLGYDWMFIETAESAMFQKQCNKEPLWLHDVVMKVLDKPPISAK